MIDWYQVSDSSDGYFTSGQWLVITTFCLDLTCSVKHVLGEDGKS